MATLESLEARIDGHEGLCEERVKNIHNRITENGKAIEEVKSTVDGIESKVDAIHTALNNLEKGAYKKINKVLWGGLLVGLFVVAKLSLFLIDVKDPMALFLFLEKLF